VLGRGGRCLVDSLTNRGRVLAGKDLCPDSVVSLLLTPVAIINHLSYMTKEGRNMRFVTYLRIQDVRILSLRSWRLRNTVRVQRTNPISNFYDHAMSHSDGLPAGDFVDRWTKVYHPGPSKCLKPRNGVRREHVYGTSEESESTFRAFRSTNHILNTVEVSKLSVCLCVFTV